MSEWVALTTPEATDWTQIVMAYYRTDDGHLIAKMGMQDGKIEEVWYGEEVMLTTEELLAIPLVAALLEACESAAFVFHQLKETEPLFQKSWNIDQALAAIDAAIAREARGERK